ncbi:MAG: hypothetical protein ABH815_05315 [Candidatus Omnitrophota bacterium]
MKKNRRWKKRILSFASFLLLSAQYSWATPTGLNNISTADVVPEEVLVLQAFVEIGKDNKPDYFTGFKFGLLKNLEIGLDGRVFPEPILEETLKAQAKYRFELSDSIALSLGIANLGDRARLGWEDYYIVLTQDLDFIRVHLGGTVQRDNEGVFAGLDKTVKLLEKDLTLRSDIIQTNDSHDVTASAGFIYDLGYNILFEAWMSFPTQSGKENIFTVKFDYVIKF